MHGQDLLHTGAGSLVKPGQPVAHSTGIFAVDTAGVDTVSDGGGGEGGQEDQEDGQHLQLLLVRRLFCFCTELS